MCVFVSISQMGVLKLKNFQVLCLDECTANIDTQTASILQNAISSECRGMTVITIAHRISTVLNMDEILILDQGNLVSFIFHCLLFPLLTLTDSPLFSLSVVMA